MRRKENEKDMITDRTQTKELDFEQMLKDMNKNKGKRGRSKKNRRRDKKWILN